MPYDQGERVTTEEFIRRKHEREGREPMQFHTGPDGENPASPPEVDPELGAPKSKPKAKAGGKRSQRSEKAAKAAVADALGVKSDSPQLADIDVTGLDAPAGTDPDGDAS